MTSSSKHTPTRRAVLGRAVSSGAAVTAGLSLGASAACAHAAPGAEGASMSGQPRVRTGAEVAAAQDWSMLRGTKLGIFSNPTGILRDTRHIVDDLAVHDDLDIRGVFGPEHGFRGSAQAGGSEGDTMDPRTGLPVYDAYGANQTKLGELFTKAGVETMVFDIQDVGARFYTYIWTLYDSMVVAARLGLRYVVLDRPNPIGGRADGALMTPGYTSGVGKKEIVQQHGMTVGELARFYNGEFLPADAGRQGRPGGGEGQRLAAGLPRPGPRPAVAASLAEHADGRHRARVRGDLLVRGHQHLRGAGDDPPVRAGRCSVPRLPLG